MPYKSEKQRRYMHAKHPEIAKRWDREGKNALYEERKGRRRRSKSRSK